MPTIDSQQVQGSLYITGLDRWHFVSYYPGLPMFQIRVEREQSVMDMISEHLDKFISTMLDKREKLEAMT